MPWNTMFSFMQVSNTLDISLRWCSHVLRTPAKHCQLSAHKKGLEPLCKRVGGHLRIVLECSSGTAILGYALEDAKNFHFDGDRSLANTVGFVW
jgi:hypothetical protein